MRKTFKKMLKFRKKISFEIFHQPLADEISHSSPPTREGVS